MRTVLLAAAGAALSMAGAAGAQQGMTSHGPGAPPPGATYPMPGAYPRPMAGNMPPPPPRPAPMHARGHHWGGRMDGHWVGGMRAPGGWAAYRRPYRGYVLPNYWLSPGFFISDWTLYGLAQPPAGYRWTRYYDDAVLIDERGSVYDTVGGIDWGRYDLDEGGYGDYAYDAGPGAGYPLPPPAPPPGRYGYAPPPPGPYAPPAVIHEGGTTITTTTSGGVSGGTWVNGYFYPPASVTTVTIQSAPVVTTTTDVIEDTVTYSRAARKVYRRHVWRPRRVPSCYCRVLPRR